MINLIHTHFEERMINIAFTEEEQVSVMFVVLPTAQ